MDKARLGTNASVSGRDRQDTRQIGDPGVVPMRDRSVGHDVCDDHSVSQDHLKVRGKAATDSKPSTASMHST